MTHARCLCIEDIDKYIVYRSTAKGNFLQKVSLGVSLRLGHAAALTATGSHSLPRRRFATFQKPLIINIF